VIAHLSGTLLEKHVQRIVVDVGGVGYDVQVPLSTFYAVGDPGARVALRVHTHVREDALSLYGFATALEQTLFEKLIGISGIGPKLALAVLSGIEPLDLITAVRLQDVAPRRVKTFSTGMRQRLLVARALLNRPRVLFLDEPVRGLDPWSAGELREMVTTLAADGVAIVLVTHDLGEAERLCRRVAVLDAGRVAALGAPDDVL